MKRNLRRRCLPALAVLLTCAAVSSARAQNTRELTLSDVIRAAVRQHPALALAEATTDRAHSGMREARASRLPSLNMDGHLTRFQEPMIVAPLHGFNPLDPPVFDRTLMQGTVALGYTVFDASRAGRVDRAEALAAAAAHGGEAARAQVIAGSARAFMQVTAAREVAAAQERRVTALEQERNRAAQLVEQGRAARVVLLRAEAALSTARADGVARKSDVEVAENELAREMGVAADDVRAAELKSVRAARDTLLAAPELRQRARSNNPELARLQRQIAGAEALRGEARGLWLPRVQLGARFVEYASPAAHAQGEWQGGAQLSYPLFTGGARTAAGDRATAEVRAAQAEYDLATRRIDEALDRALSMLSAARARAGALEAAVSQSEEVTRIDLLALDAGAGVQTDYLTAEADLFRARAALTEAVVTELLARIEIARLTGDLNEDWFAKHVESNP